MTANFSLTENVIINPVLRFRAPPLDTPDNPLSFSGSVVYFLQSEVIARMIAVATSFFAMADSIAHLSIGIVKGGNLGLRKLGIRCFDLSPYGSAVSSHFKQASKFLGIALIGSIAATVWPEVLRYFPISPEESSSPDWESTSETVRQLWNKVADTKVFEALWLRAYIEDKRHFVHNLDRDTTKTAQTAQSELNEIVYTKKEDIRWPRQKGEPTFYHATSRKGLEGILKSGAIEVRHEKAYRGAFVSTKPETMFGKYILVFNRNIERLSHLNHGFPMHKAYWAGFSRHIPVNALTLNQILVAEDQYSSLETDCDAWAGRKITVQKLQSHTFEGDKKIPREWPDTDERATAIKETMEIRLKQSLAQMHTSSSLAAIWQQISFRAPLQSLRAIPSKLLKTRIQVSQNMVGSSSSRVYALSRQRVPQAN